MGEETHHACYPDPFQWLHHGELVRYLGCMVGIDLRPEAMLSSLLLSIKRKILCWDAQQLSFAGRIAVENSILLVSMWFIASVWLFSRSGITRVQILIHNFLWGEGGETWISNNSQSCLECGNPT